LESIFPGGGEQDAPLDMFGCGNLIQKYLATKDLVKTYQQEQEQCRQAIQQSLGNAESGVCGDYSVIWKQQSHKTFDLKRFAADHPEIDLGGYYKKSTFRKFDIKENTK
jgi:predicted phage-related endonuclease